MQKDLYRLVVAVVLLATAVISAEARHESVISTGEEPGDTAIMYYYPATEPSGIAIVGCPGGGYAAHAMGREGHDFASWLNGMGVDYAVVKYRLPRGRHEVPAEDVRAAISRLRELSGARKVGVMGFSAGGHLASTVAVQAVDSVERPDFQILFYPVITMDPTFTHEGTRLNLLGENSSEALEEKYSGERQVDSATPPALIFHCSDDNVVPVKNAIEYYTALQGAGVDVEMHIYPEGGHGWGFRDTFVYKPQWKAAMQQWLERVAP